MIFFFTSNEVHKAKTKISLITGIWFSFETHNFIQTFNIYENVQVNNSNSFVLSGFMIYYFVVNKQVS